MDAHNPPQVRALEIIVTTVTGPPIEILRSRPLDLWNPIRLADPNASIYGMVW
jgi:hypothetical protein